MKQFLVSERSEYLLTIVQFIYEKMIKGRKWQMFAAVCMGIIIRMLTVVGFAMTLQAVVATIRPELILSIANRLFERFNAEIVIDKITLVTILIVSLLMIYGISVFAQFIRSRLIGALILHMVGRKENFINAHNIEDDMVFIEQLPSKLEAVVKCIEISFFMLILIMIIFIFVPYLALFLLPLIAMLVSFQVIGDRNKLREIQLQQDVRIGYMKVIDDEGKSSQRLVAENNLGRDEYCLIRDKRRHNVTVKPQIDAFIGAIAIAVVIYYLFSIDLAEEQLAGMMIVFVVSIRYVIASGRELSVNVSRILELRKYKHVLNSYLLTGNES